MAIYKPKDPSVVRVEIEYDNGDIERATGVEAAEIWRYLNSGQLMNYIHGAVYTGPKLKLVKAKSDAV